MRRRCLLLAAVSLVLLFSAAARAHLIPIPASACRFEPVTVSVPGTSLTGVADAATPADDFRILFDTGASQAVFCPADTNEPSGCGTPVPRAFTLDGTNGTLTLPSNFAADMLASGELIAADVPVTLTLDGITIITPVTLTTGLVSTADGVVSGAPIAGFGSLTFVGVARGAGLPAPVDGRDVLLRLTCQFAPNPDKDQFTAPASLTTITGQLAADGGKLRALLNLNPFVPNALDGHALRLLIRLDDTTVATGTLSNGLQPQGKRLLGTSDDGGIALVGRLRGTSQVLLQITVKQTALPTLTPKARVVMGITLDGGGVLARGESLFQVSRNGRKLH